MSLLVYVSNDSFFCTKAFVIVNLLNLLIVYGYWCGGLIIPFVSFVLEYNLFGFSKVDNMGVIVTPCCLLEFVVLSCHVENVFQHDGISSAYLMMVKGSGTVISSTYKK